MKVICNILILCSIILFSCQTAIAQPLPNPKVSTKYTNTEVDKLIEGYRMQKSRDIRPTQVLSNRLKADFPSARDIEWEEAAGIYKVEFEIGSKDYDAYYDAEANLLMYIVEIRERELPAIVKNAFITKYPDYKVDRDAKKIYKGTDTYYVVELEKGRTEVKITISKDGTIMREKNY